MGILHDGLRAYRRLVTRLTDGYHRDAINELLSCLAVVWMAVLLVCLVGRLFGLHVCGVGGC